MHFYVFILLSMVSAFLKCSELTHSFAISYGPPHHVGNRFRIDFHNCSPEEARWLFGHQATKSSDHPVRKAIRESQMEKIAKRCDIVSTSGAFPFRGSSERNVKFSVFYGFHSEEEALNYKEKSAC